MEDLFIHVPEEGRREIPFMFRKRIAQIIEQWLVELSDPALGEQKEQRR